MSNGNGKNDGTIRAFTTLVAGLEEGQLAADCTDKLEDLMRVMTRQLEAVGKARGKFTLSLTFNMSKGGAVDIDGEIVVKEPKPLREQSTRWITEEGRLAGKNPKQLELGVREVPKPPTADPKTPEAGEHRSV